MGRLVAFLIAIVGATVLVAGCMGPAEDGDPSAGGLGPPGEADGERRATNHTLATWNQSGLVEAFPNASEDYEIRHVEPGDGIAYEAPNLTEREGELVLHEVVWGGPGEEQASSGREQFQVEEPRTVKAFLEERRNRSEARALFEAFARDVTDADEATIDRWADDLVSSREEAGTGTDRRGRSFTLMVYRASLDEPLTLDPLVDVLEDADAEHRRTETGLHVENETWRLRFAIPHATATSEDDAARLEVSVTARERAIALVGASQTPDEQEVRERVRHAFEDLGLPEPTFDGFETRSFEPR